MSVIDDLYKKLGLHSGSWNVLGVPLPDAGITEAAANKLSGGQTTDLSKAITQKTATPTKSSTGFASGFSGGSSGGASGGGGGGSVGGSGSNPNPDTTYVNVDGNRMKLRDAIGEGKANPDGSLRQSADNSYQSRLGAIRERLNMMKDIANRSIERARGVRDEVVGNISNTYQGLLDSAGVKKDTSLQNLDTEGINTQNTYGRAEGKARRAMEGAIARNRMMARATNRLNSSFYDDRQAATTETASKNVADIALEEAGKLAGIDTRKTETKNWFEQESQRIAGERDGLKSQADREYQDSVNSANDMERSFGIDNADALSQAADEYQSRIAAIDNYAMNRALQIASIAAQNAASGRAGIESFSAIDPSLASKLADTSAVDKSASTDYNNPVYGFTSSNNAGNNGTDLTAFYKQDEQTSAYKKMLARLGLLATA